MTRDLLAAAEATWPAFATRRVGPWTIRDGRGGGKRVSAATVERPFNPGDIVQAEQAMAEQGQPPLFMIRPQDAALDAALADLGYGVLDPVDVLAADPADLPAPQQPMRVYTMWPPLAVVERVWTENGIGPERQAVMDRAPGPKTAILGRSDDRAAGAAFVAMHEKTAVLHALTVSPAFRRQGIAVNILCEAAQWALDNGGNQLITLVTRANNGGHALYASLGMQPVEKYHYRRKVPGKEAEGI